jgi:CheY-like chemotaxis protein
MQPEKLHILLAEDDRDDRLFFKDAFSVLKIQHSLTICEDGTTLMDHLNTTANLPDIIFLDINMPGKNGMECLREMKASERLRDISVAIFSSLTSEQIQEEAFIAGANVYIKKPNDLEVLRKILSEVVCINWLYMTDGLNRENFMLNY